MSALFGSRPSDGPPDRVDTELVARKRDVEVVRRRWELRSAQWRALSLARFLFGPDTRVRLAGPLDDPPRGPFRALLHLEVPFQELEAHRARETAFTAWAGEDPVLTRIPFIYVFSPLVPSE